ncbi:MAG: Xaa-Pro aminopeptidase [Thermoleophilaceae bacterium]|jgi:Xaa-Pro aminopeptidase|nr:Xaa-Pro aminopeptidase [Thermoleophilaceae bacterium]
MADGILIHGDTHRSASLRHELPLGILDPFSYFELDGRRVAVIASMEAVRIEEIAPGIEVIDPYELGLDELIGQGMRWDELEPELCLRAAQHLGVHRLVVPSELPVTVADRLRAEGIEVIPDEREFIARRRSKSPSEVEGVRRAQAAAHAGMAAAAEMLRAAEPAGDPAVLHLDGEPLTAEAVRARIRAVCAEHGAPTDDDIIVAAGPAGATGHEHGRGPLPAGVPVIIDIWPRDERSGCFADMTRTFVAGAAPADDVREWHGLAQAALEGVYAVLRPGVTGQELYAAACEVFEEAGEPTQRTKAEGELLQDGFFHSLGHGVGLQVHEEPSLGRTGAEPLVPGDVVAIEPGCYRSGYGGVRLEDLALITDDGFERLTDFPYELEL